MCLFDLLRRITPSSPDALVLIYHVYPIVMFPTPTPSTASSVLSSSFFIIPCTVLHLPSVRRNIDRYKCIYVYICTRPDANGERVETGSGAESVGLGGRSRSPASGRGRVARKSCDPELATHIREGHRVTASLERGVEGQGAGTLRIVCGG